MNVFDMDDDGVEYTVGVDTNEKPTGRPVYFSFTDKKTHLEFWFSCEQTEEMIAGLQNILDDIKSGAAYDARH